MPMTSAQIVTQACLIARVPGFTTIAGNELNAILSDLCQTYDFQVAKQTYTFTLPTGGQGGNSVGATGLNSQGQAFINLPTNYLRAIKWECYYLISGVPYPMIPCDQEEFDMLVQQANVANFPIFFTTDMTLTGATNNGFAGFPVMLFWQVPSGAYQAYLRYYSQMTDISNPATSGVVPWFPNQSYLLRRLSGEMMKYNDDDRIESFLSDNEDRFPNGAGVMLRKYLQQEGDKSTRTKQVQLDRRRFGTSFDRLKNTKTIGW
jgi:hypothetical protein